MAKRRKRAARHYGDGFTQAERLKINRAKTPAEWKVAHAEAVAARAKRNGYRTNPLVIGTPEKIGIGVGLAAGVAAIIYYVTRPSTAAAPVLTPHATGGGLVPGSSGGGTLVPGSSGGGSTTTSGPQTYTVDETMDGQTVNMHIGDTLLVSLNLAAGVTDYNGTATGTLLTQGVYDNTAGHVSQAWVAVGAGSEAVTYQRAVGSAPGASITYNIVIS